jgi:hypothetical protein
MPKNTEPVLVDVVESGRKGGEARAANMSPKQRSESARKAAAARWSKNKPGPKRRP